MRGDRLPSLRVLWLALLLSAGMVISVRADSVSATVDRLLEACGQSEGFPAPIAACLLRHEAEYGTQLAAAYRTLLEGRMGDQRRLLLESQRAWLKYQDTTCRFYAEYFASEGTGIAKVSSALCLLRTTLTRLEELRPG